MGVDWYACSNCEETFPDCGPMESCECSKMWCGEKCAKEDGLRDDPEGFKPPGSDWEQEKSCKYCRAEDYDDWVLLQYCLDEMGLSREQLIKKFKESDK